MKKNMPYILIAGIAFGSDFWIKRHMDRKYARYVVHPGRRNKILIEKYYNRGAALNFLAKKPRVMRALHTVIMFFVGILYISCSVCRDIVLARQVHLYLSAED